MSKINFEENAKFLARAIAKTGISVEDFIKNCCGNHYEIEEYEKSLIETDFFKERFYKRK